MKAQLQISDPHSWLIVGPTASGKTAVAQLIAEQWPAEILSADAMLVYTGMDIGTAKPGAAERARVRYHGIDLVDPMQRFSAGAYRLAALGAVREAQARSCPLIVVGGSGLYIKTITDGLDLRAPGNEKIRAEAERRLAAEGISALQDWLRRVAPESYASLSDPRNPRRLIRALETSLLAETPGRGKWLQPLAGSRIPGLLWSRPQLYNRILSRVQAMFAGGLLDEVERLLKAGFDQAPTATQAIGYAEAAAYLRKQCSLEDAVMKTALRSRQLAKRQMTWFRHQCNVDWLPLDGAMTTAAIADLVRASWRKNGPTPVAVG